mmetsp:Transcript_44889/g.113751  ORF Transcript_44889/g.113751 Transcript_44889/m.113751 type:complete len:199 (-) Transcript_44889:195-791(-)
MTGQGGLRLINNNYVSGGDGRDALICYDAGYRGGSQGMTRVHQHFPAPKADSPKLLRPIGSTLGWDARTEAHSQHLNCSGSMFKKTGERKLKMTSEGWTKPAPPRSSLASTALELERSLTRSTSEPGATFSPMWRDLPKQRPSIFGGATRPGAMMREDCDMASEAGSVRADVPSWSKPVRFNSMQCCARTAGGGFWAK